MEQTLYSNWVSRVFGGWPYVFLIVDSLGSRGMNRDLEHGCGPAGPNSHVRAMDAGAARLWLAAQTFVDSRRIAVIGWSAGDSAVLAAIAKETSNATGGPGSFAAAVAFYPTCPPRLHDSNVPLLLLVGDADHVNSWERCRDMEVEAEIAPEYQIVVYPGATHSFDRPRPRRIVFGQERRRRDRRRLPKSASISGSIFAVRRPVLSHTRGCPGRLPCVARDAPVDADVGCVLNV
jgi:dienelactone hydrolase